MSELDPEARQFHHAHRLQTSLRITLPFCALALGIALWHGLVRFNDMPAYVLPGPLLVFETIVSDWRILSSALLTTLSITAQALMLAVIGGVG
ncbi:MAG TPA: ABC transporter permease, partial [Xanthobacteraceae bacterium]|nr:ABC transporter permease [Xanthobacteraceae bacterium]